MSGGSCSEVAQIEVENLSKHFGAGESRFTALKDVNLSIRSNEFLTFLGPSGCGKTTLLRIIGGFEYPTEGRVLLSGKDVSFLPPYARSVNTVFQSYALFPHMTVAENISFGLKMLNRGKTEISSAVEAMLKLVKMESLRDRKPVQLSGGQQQRVALARALAPRPRVLLLDEPLSALDYKLRKGMQLELKRLQAETGITFVFVTHDQEEALAMSDRIAVMSAGSVLQIGPPQEIHDQPANRFVADFIGETNFLQVDILERGAEGMVTVTLKNGTALRVSCDVDIPASPHATISIRPSFLRLVPEGQGSWTGRVQNRIYSGNGTQFQLCSDWGETLTVRQQAGAAENVLASVGNKVDVIFTPGKARLLKD